jgi:hypothetical protein
VLYKSFVDAKALQQELQSVEGQSTEDAEGMPIDHTVIMIRRLLQEDVSLTEAYKRIYDRVYLTYNEKYGFMEEKEYSCFSYEAVLSRIRRGRMEHVHPGQHTPAAELEPLVAQLCIRASQSNNSLSQREVVDLMNSVLKGSQCEKTIIQWKLKHCKTMRGVAITKLGDSWFRGFIKRFPELKIAKQSDVNMNRDSWCTYHNLRDMYDILFQYWVNEGYCLPLAAPQWQDRFGNIVDVNDPHRMGRKVKLEWIHGNRMLCFDEVSRLFLLRCPLSCCLFSFVISCFLSCFPISDFRVNSFQSQNLQLSKFVVQKLCTNVRDFFVLSLLPT